MTTKELIQKNDDLVRAIFKLKYYPRCVICGKRGDWYHPVFNRYGITVGHYIKRSCKALRWDFKNLAPQCSICNSIHNDNEEPYKLYMIKTYGKEILDYYDSNKRLLLNKSNILDIYELLQIELKGLQNINKL